MNRRSFFRLGLGAGLAPLTGKLVPLCLAPAVQKMDTSRLREYYNNEEIRWVHVYGKGGYDIRFLNALKRNAHPDHVVMQATGASTFVRCD